MICPSSNESGGGQCTERSTSRLQSAVSAESAVARSSQLAAWRRPRRVSSSWNADENAQYARIALAEEFCTHTYVCSSNKYSLVRARGQVRGRGDKNRGFSSRIRRNDSAPPRMGCTSSAACRDMAANFSLGMRYTSHSHRCGCWPRACAVTVSVPLLNASRTQLRRHDDDDGSGG